MLITANKPKLYPVTVTGYLSGGLYCIRMDLGKIVNVVNGLEKCSERLEREPFKNIFGGTNNIIQLSSGNRLQLNYAINIFHYT